MKGSVLFVAPSAYPLGGVAEWLDYLLPGLQSFGWQLELALVAGGAHDPAAYLKRHPWHQVRELRNRTGSSEGRVRAMQSLIRAVAPDLVVAVNLVDVYEAIRRVRNAEGAHAGPRVVMALHGLQADLAAEIASQDDVLDAVITPSRLATALAGRLCGDPRRAFYAPCGVSMGKLHARAHSSGVPPLRLLYVGRVEQEQKRVFDLPPLLAGLVDRGADATMSIAGQGVAMKHLRDRFDSLGVSGRVTWLGDIGRISLERAYAEHDVLVITSSWETGPLVAWEAMSRGVVVLSSRYLGAAAEQVLVDGVNARLFPVGDIEAAVGAAAELTSAELRETLAQQAWVSVKNRYSIEVSTLAWNESLFAVLDLPRRAHPGPMRLGKPSGRLDRVLGVSLAETVRQALGISRTHSDPGAAWPHRLVDEVDEVGFNELARRLDRDLAAMTDCARGLAPFPAAKAN